MNGRKTVYLNDLLTCKHPGLSQLILIYGRNLAGKSELLLHWAAQSSFEYTYWEVIKELPVTKALRLCRCNTELVKQYLLGAKRLSFVQSQAK